jgi:agmatinase
MPTKTFLDLKPPFCDVEGAAVALLPVPYEGGVSYGRGTALAPQAVLDASAYLELYDEVLREEPYRAGIATLPAPALTGTAETAMRTLYDTFTQHLRGDVLVVAVGGDHSITVPHVQALHRKYKTLSVIQIDAHADLRDSYDDSSLSHACVMRRVRETGANTLQIGIRSLSKEEADLVADGDIPICMMHEYRDETFDLGAALNALPDPVFLTLDVDALDWSVVAATGTPEPGGFTWDESISLLDRIFTCKNVVGFDVVELACEPGDRNSPFAVSKLIYKMIGRHVAKARLLCP